MISYNPSIVRNGLVLHLDAANVKSYPGTGTVWKDLSGNGNHGTLVNGVGYNSADKGSMVFDGANDYVDFGDTLDFGTNDCTIISWLKITSEWTTGSRYFVSKSKAAPQAYRYGFGFTPTRQLRGFMNGGGADIIPNTINTVPLNQWCMCTMIIKRGSALSLYLNDVVQSVDSSDTISQWYNLNFQSSNPFRVGSYTDPDNITPTLFFPGIISTTSVYFRALSAAEIQQNFNATRGRYGI